MQSNYLKFKLAAGKGVQQTSETKKAAFRLLPLACNMAYK